MAASPGVAVVMRDHLHWCRVQVEAQFGPFSGRGGNFARATPSLNLTNLGYAPYKINHKLRALCLGNRHAALGGCFELVRRLGLFGVHALCHRSQALPN